MYQSLLCFFYVTLQYLDSPAVLSISMRLTDVRPSRRERPITRVSYYTITMLLSFKRQVLVST